MKPAVFHFQVPFNISAKVDDQAGIIRGAAVITGGVSARGHDLQVDEKTLDQIVECGQAKGKVQVKLNHKSGVESICGYLSGFRKEGNKVLADWHLLKSHEEYEKIIEKAQRMPDCFGLSAAFAGPKKGERQKDGKYSARCTELLAVDCVTMPAANPDGLFEANVPFERFETGSSGALVDRKTSAKSSTQMPEETTPTQEPTNAQIMEAITGLRSDLSKRIDGIEQRQNELTDILAEGTPLSREELEELNGMSDDELAEQGLDRAQITAAIEALDAAPASGDSPADAAASAGKTGAPAASTSPAADAGVATALSSLRRDIVELKTKLGEKEEADEVSEILTAFDALEEKYTAVCAQNAALQNQLRLHGVKAASPGRESERMFSAQEGDENVTEFEAHVTHLLNTKAAKTKGEAVQLAIKQKPRAYAEYRSKRGVSTLADEE